MVLPVTPPRPLSSKTRVEGAGGGGGLAYRTGCPPPVRTPSRRTLLGTTHCRVSKPPVMHPSEARHRQRDDMRTFTRSPYFMSKNLAGGVLPTVGSPPPAVGGYPRAQRTRCSRAVLRMEKKIPSIKDSPGRHCERCLPIIECYASEVLHFHWRSILRAQTFLGASEPPPPPLEVASVGSPTRGNP